MSEIESTFEDERRHISTICVVYDERDGRIVHTHEFIGDGSGIFGREGREEQERMALDFVKRHEEPQRLKVMQAPPDFQLEPETVHCVDQSSGQIVTDAERTQ